MIHRCKIQLQLFRRPTDLKNGVLEHVANTAAFYILIDENLGVIYLIILGLNSFHKDPHRKCHNLATSYLRSYNSANGFMYCGNLKYLATYFN